MGQRNGVALNYPSGEGLAQRLYSTNSKFLDIYLGSAVLKTETRLPTWPMPIWRARADSVVDAGDFSMPDAHRPRPGCRTNVINICTVPAPKRRRVLALTASLIFHFPAPSQPEEEASTNAEQALPLRDKIVGIGLASSRKWLPPLKGFARVVRTCAHARLGLHSLAGPSPGRKAPPAIWSALDVLKVGRIDHGIRSHSTTLP
ncbi:MAG: hypothetical protein IPH37_19965 [Burkholderiales bacterium]|nr:hypothetical protein [Burkholderiales bacterium]